MVHPTARVLLPTAAIAAVLAACAAPGALDRGGTASSQDGEAMVAAMPHADTGWLLLGRTEGASLYIHPRSTLRVGSSAFIMVVAAKHRPTVLPDGATIGSLKERYEIDCPGRRYRRHDGTAHADGAGLGPILGTVGQDQWKGISPQTVMAAVSSAVCAGPAPDAFEAPPGPGLRLPRRATRVFRT